MIIYFHLFQIYLSLTKFVALQANSSQPQQNNNDIKKEHVHNLRQEFLQEKPDATAPGNS